MFIFLELVRYIHLNPVRSGVLANLEELDRYPYCGHSALMGKRMRKWQDIGYVLGYFEKRVGAARKAYRSYVEKGIALGKRPELTGGGLIRSLGGWDEVRKRSLSGQDRIKSDQRILGESEFVMDVLSESEGQSSRRYALKTLGYDYEKVLGKVSELFHLEKDYITEKRQTTGSGNGQGFGLLLVCG